MIQLVKTGDIFTLGADAIVNTVNTVGVMGGGLALEFKKRFPEMNTEYVRLCKSKHIRVGEVSFWHNPQPPPKYIINFPTKDHWVHPSKLEWVTTGLWDLREKLSGMNDIKSIGIPALGCGLGGLNFAPVLAAVESTLADLDIEITLYEPR